MAASVVPTETDATVSSASALEASPGIVKENLQTNQMNGIDTEKPAVQENDEALAQVILPPSPERYDNRILWIKSRLKQSLFDEFNLELHNATNESISVDLFSDCLERNNRRSLRELIGYLDDALHQSTLLFYLVHKSGSAVKVLSAEDKVIISH